MDRSLGQELTRQIPIALPCIGLDLLLCEFRKFYSIRTINFLADDGDLFLNGKVELV